MQSDMATALTAGSWFDDSEAKEGGGGTSVEAGGGVRAAERAFAFLI